MKGVLIRLKVGEGDVLFYIDRKVKRKRDQRLAALHRPERQEKLLIDR